MSSRSRKRVRIAGVVLLIAAALAFVWPLHALVSRFHPMVFGVPFSLVWIVLGQLSVFLALLMLYLTEE